MITTILPNGEPFTFEPTPIDKVFVLAGKATLTIDNGNGKHYTFRVTKKEPEPSSRYARFGTSWFVSLLTGQNNETDYTYLGMLEPATGSLRLTKASKMTDTSTPVTVARWTFSKVWKGEPFPDGYTLMNEGRCGRCGRTLTVPESLISGYGPECIGKV